MTITDIKKNIKAEYEKAIKIPIIEGVVLKNLAAKLDYHYTTDKCKWMGKVRKPTNNYAF